MLRKNLGPAIEGRRRKAQTLGLNEKKDEKGGGSDSSPLRG